MLLIDELAMAPGMILAVQRWLDHFTRHLVKVDPFSNSDGAICVL